MRVPRRTVLAAGVAAATAAVLPGPASADAVPVLFVAAHPDDELLMAGVSLAEHVDGGAAVHVLWLTDGTASGARDLLNGWATSSWWAVPHHPAAEGYSPLAPAEFGAARIREAGNAVAALAAPGTVITHRAGLPDGQITAAAAADAILAVADLIAPGGPVRVKTHTHLVDNSPDHKAAGTAARQLKVDQPDRFGDLRHYVESPYWSDPRLAQVADFWDLPATAAVAARVRNACRAYGAWAPPHTFAVGYHSVPGLLDHMANSPRNLLHP